MPCAMGFDETMIPTGLGVECDSYRNRSVGAVTGRHGAKEPRRYTAWEMGIPPICVTAYDNS